MDKIVLDRELEDEVKSGMMFINAVSLPIKAFGIVSEKLLNAHPMVLFGQVSANELLENLNDSIRNSSIGKQWTNIREKIIVNLYRTGISVEETEYCLDSLEEIVIAFGIKGAIKLAKSANSLYHSTSLGEISYFLNKLGDLPASIGIKEMVDFAKSVRQTYAQLTEIHIINGIYFKPYKNVLKRFTRIYEQDTPAEGFVEYSYARGTQISVFDVTPDILSYNISRYIPYITQYITYNEYMEIPKMRSFDISQNTPKYDPIYASDLKMAEYIPSNLDDIHNSYVTEPELDSVTAKYMPHSESELNQEIETHINGHEQKVDENHSFISLGEQVLDFAGKVTGVNSAIDELVKINEILHCLVTNPSQVPIKMIASVLRRPESVIRNILDSPKTIMKDFMSLSTVFSVLSFMDSINWMFDLFHNPKGTIKSMILMPYTIVKSVIDLGTSLIRNPGKTVELLFKSLIHTPERIVSKFFTNIGLKRKKKRRIESQSITISPEDQKRYIKDLTSLYCIARFKGFIDPDKTIEKYHYDLMEDWGLFNAGCSFFDFPQLIIKQMEENSWIHLRSYSPKAHPYRPAISSEIMSVSVRLEEERERLNNVSNDLNCSIQGLTKSTERLKKKQEKLIHASAELDIVLRNSERLKQALVRRRQS